MTEQELRLLVREAINRHGGQARSPEPAGVAVMRPIGGLSFSQFGVPSGPDGSCIIEPSVMCNHCGYCKSYGH